MKFVSLLPLAVVTTAFVLPNAQINKLRDVEVEDNDDAHCISDIVNNLEKSIHRTITKVEDAVDPLSDHVRKGWERYSEQGRHILDDVLDYVEDTGEEVGNNVRDTYFDSKAWLESTMESAEQKMLPMGGGHHGHHGHHGHRSNKTVWQLISSSEYTTELTKLIEDYPDIVKALNSTSSNYTVFAPTDRAFQKIPKGAPKPSKEVLEKILSYHVSPELYPAGRILVSKTIPTLLKSDSLGDKPLPQRLSTAIGFRGLKLNFYSKVVAVDIFGSNGVIHGIDSILLPPPPAVQIIDLVPGQFSTLELGLQKTGLLEKLNTTKHPGGTLFAPSNFAFQKLGTRLNAFLFSQYGLKYLKPLLEYHVVPATTVYSDAIYKGKLPDEKFTDEVMEEHAHTNVPRSIVHLELPSLLKKAPLGVDIRRYGRLIEIKINAFTRVTVSDAVAQDGVLHVINNVLIPPKRLSNGEYDVYDGSYELSEEEFEERMSPYVTEDMKPQWMDL